MSRNSQKIPEDPFLGPGIKSVKKLKFTFATRLFHKKELIWQK